MRPSSCVTPAGTFINLTSRINGVTTHTHTHTHTLRTRHHLCRQGVALASTRQLRLQGPVSAQAHHTEGVTRSGGREGANGVGGGSGVEGGN